MEDQRHEAFGPDLAAATAIVMCVTVNSTYRGDDDEDSDKGQTVMSSQLTSDLFGAANTVGVLQNRGASPLRRPPVILDRGQCRVLYGCTWHWDKLSRSPPLRVSFASGRHCTRHGAHADPNNPPNPTPA
jgi:hypothetical protein